MKTYTQNMHCKNCGETFVREFSKGRSCEGSYECINCGCETAIATGMAENVPWGISNKQY